MTDRDGMSRRGALAALAAGLVAPTLGSGPVSAQTQTDPWIARLGDDIGKLLAASHTAGAALVIVQDGAVVLQRTYGLRDLARQLPVEADTLFPIASVSKTFTGLAAAIAVGEGKLAWNTHPRDLLPYFRLKDAAADRQVTLTHLLSHTSGVARADLNWQVGGLSSVEQQRVLGDADVLAAIGQEWHYQNQMFAAAGDMVGAAYGTSWADFVRRRILEPLGMRASRTTVAGFNEAPNAAKGYQYHTGGSRHSRLYINPMDAIGPAGAMCTTLRDLTAYVHMLAEGGRVAGRPLAGRAAFDTMIEPRYRIGGNIHYALGWMVHQDPGLRLIEHGGNGWGYSAQVGFVPSHRLGIGLLTNANVNPACEQILRGVVSSLLPPSAAAAARRPEVRFSPDTHDPRAAAALAEHQSVLRDLLGRYRDGMDEAEIRIEAGRVVLAFLPQPARVLGTPVDDRIPIEGTASSFVQVILGADRRITGIRIVEPAGEQELSREPTDIDAEEVIRRLQLSVGGSEQIGRIRSLIVRGRIEKPFSGVTGRFVRYREAPHRYAETQSFEGLGRPMGAFRTYFDGERYGIEAGNQHQPIDPAAVAGARLEHDLMTHIAWAVSGSDLILAGRARLEGRPVYALRSPDNPGGVARLYVDAETHLPAQLDVVVTSPTAEHIVSRRRYSDWRVVSGLDVRLPFEEINVAMPGDDTIYRVEAIELNAAIDPVLFGPRITLPEQ